MAKKLQELSLRDIIPQSIAGDPQVQAIISALDPELQSVSLDIREALIYSRIDELPEAVLDLLAWQWHVDFYEPAGMNVEIKRNIVKSAIMIHRKKGTPWAVRRFLTDLGFHVEYTEWWQFGGEPCVDRLKVWVGEDFEFSPEARALVMRAWESVKAARTHLESLFVGLWFLDETQIIDEGVFSLRTITPHFDLYPWPGLYYGQFDYGDIKKYGNFTYGEGEYGGLKPGTRRYGDEFPDLLSNLSAALSGMEEEYRVPSVYGASMYGNFNYGFAAEPGAQDEGGEITCTRRRVYGRFNYGDGAAYYGSAAYGDFIYGSFAQYGEEIYREAI